MLSQSRGSQLIQDIERLSKEAQLVYSDLVLPGWSGPQHGLPNTLFGFIMGAFARLDLMSAYWRGSFDSPTERMVSFMANYMGTDRLTNSLAVHLWRHKLMHTAAPRAMTHQSSGVTYHWLLHWGDVHLPRDQHFKFQPNGYVLNLSLAGLIDDTRDMAKNYIFDLHGDKLLEQNFDAIEAELASYRFRTV